jgi:type II secretory pathway pseudopilin PulG
MEGFTKRQEQRRGFNLIEAAIVLGVVGIVLGAIWYAAASFYESYKVNKTVEGIFETSRNIQKLMSSSNAIALGNHDSTGLDLTQELIPAGVFPENWVEGSTVKHPFGGYVYIKQYISTPRFDLYIRNITTHICMQLANRVTSMEAQAKGTQRGYYVGTGLGRITINYGSGFFSAFPVSLDAAKTLCDKPSNGNWILFTFAYTRIN